MTVAIRGLEPTWLRYLDIAIRTTPKIRLLFNSEFIAIQGEQEITAVSVRTGDRESTSVLPAAGMFVFIGQRPPNGTKHGVAAAAGDGNAAVSMFWQYRSTI